MTAKPQVSCEQIRVRGLVQGVGFRPTVWRIATDMSLAGDVRNDGEGVLIHVWGNPPNLDEFCRQLENQCPPLARIDSLERRPDSPQDLPEDFRIVSSDSSEVRTGVVPDAATCDACRTEIFDKNDRRYRYPFTNCTHCGPRLTIIESIPYDRVNTSMSGFVMCPECEREYEDPADRRFHAQPNACPMCGPRAWLEDAAGEPIPADFLGAEDAIDAASQLLAQGRILAIKGIGGYHLACAATNPGAVATLRKRKRRFEKPFALMARDLDVVRRYCQVDDKESDLLKNSAAPIVLLERKTDANPLADAIAPGQQALGVMLPYSPLHHLLLANWDTPLVMTSGNLSDEPQCTDNADAGGRLSDIADCFLQHDRPIRNRVDDSVTRIMAGRPRFLRRARGYAPSPLPMPPGLENSPAILAMGGELKNTFCLAKNGQAIVSQHVGDLEDGRTAEDYEHNLALYKKLFELEAEVLAVDLHPNYRSTQLGQELADDNRIPCIEIQHHHAHLASVLAENLWPADGGPVLGISLDGLGYGDDGTIWGGEFLVGDYRDYQRVGLIKPTPMPGGTKAILEPWRNTWAQLHAHVGWKQVRARWKDLELVEWLSAQPLNTLAAMVDQGVNSPSTSSCGRLFDAVAGALNLQRQEITYEGQAAIELETLAQKASPSCGSYRFGLEPYSENSVCINTKPMWESLLEDLANKERPADMAMRFHSGLSDTISHLAQRLCHEWKLNTVALSGGVFQNRTLFEAVCRDIESSGLQILSHEIVPTNDGGLSLGQAAIAAACSRE